MGSNPVPVTYKLCVPSYYLKRRDKVVERKTEITFAWLRVNSQSIAG